MSAPMSYGDLMMDVMTGPPKKRRKAKATTKRRPKARKLTGKRNIP